MLAWLARRESTFRSVILIVFIHQAVYLYIVGMGMMLSVCKGVVTLLSNRRPIFPTAVALSHIQVHQLRDCAHNLTPSLSLINKRCNENVLRSADKSIDPFNELGAAFAMDGPGGMWPTPRVYMLKHVPFD